MKTIQMIAAGFLMSVAASTSAFAAADVVSTPVFKVNGANAQFDIIFVNRGPDIAQKPTFGARLIPGLNNVACVVGHNQNSQPLPAGSATASYSAATGVVTLGNLAGAATTPGALKDDEAFVARCTMPCEQSAIPAAWSEMGAANAGKNEDGIDRANSAVLKIKVNICK